VEVKEEEEEVGEMMHREGHASRRKNIEDVNDIEEKGLYNGYLPASSEKGDGVRDKLLSDRDRSPGEEREGLHSKRDKEAFALLVVLCEPALDRVSLAVLT